MSGITGDFYELDSLIVRFGQMSVERAASVAAPALESVARAQWASGMAPDGTPWPPTKDGRVALVELTAQIEVTAEGSAIVMRGPDELRPHFERRPVWPAPGEEMPDAWKAPIEKALREEIEGT